MRDRYGSLYWLVRTEIKAANAGRWPDTYEEWERVAKRFGARVRRVPRHLVQDPIILSTPVTIVIPDPAPEHLIQRWLAHEVAEVCLLWEGVAPYRWPHGDRHAVARLVELHSAPPHS